MSKDCKSSIGDIYLYGNLQERKKKFEQDLMSLMEKLKIRMFCSHQKYMSILMLGDEEAVPEKYEPVRPNIIANACFDANPEAPQNVPRGGQECPSTPSSPTES